MRNDVGTCAAWLAAGAGLLALAATPVRAQVGAQAGGAAPPEASAPEATDAPTAAPPDATETALAPERPEAALAPAPPEAARASDDEFDALLEAAGIDWEPREEAEEPADLAGRLRRALAPVATRVGRALRERLPPEWAQHVEALGDARAGMVGLLAAQVLAGVLALLLAARLLRGRGDLVVCLHYPAELRGTFTVRIARGKARSRRAPRVTTAEEAKLAALRAGTATHTRHPRVSRETQFLGLATGTWFATIEGFLQTGDDTVLANHFEESQVRVRRGHAERVDFDLNPRHCPVELRVSWDRRAPGEAFVAVRGQPGSLRAVKNGAVRVGVGPGRHVFVVGSGDRVAELPIEVDSFAPVQLSVDLAERAPLLFSGCPPAVEPYLHGDVPAAARALERDGQESVAHQLQARFHEERDQKEAAARHYEAAGLYAEAGLMRRGLCQFKKAGALFEQGGDFARAADMYRSAGLPLRAGESWERAGDYDRAAECFQRAGDVPRWIECLEKQGLPFEAGEVAIKSGDWVRAIRSFQLVSPTHPRYHDAASYLSEGYQRQGHTDLAARKLEEILEAKGRDGAPLETCDRLARLLEETGDTERALAMLEVIRERDVTWPNVATRIEGLRKRRSAEQSASGSSGVTGFSGEFRYEILEEIGRGGMGIVFRARDRRLGRTVALKQLPDNLRNHPRAIDLFFREARAAAALNHPNIVTVHDAGQEGDTYYIAMELLEGSPLQQILHQNGRLRPRDVARLGVQIATGLQYAHDQKIIHRDIKTGNLFFTHSRTMKIMDFGLAKMVEEVRRASTVIGGTPYYMAPEQAIGKKVGPAADVYAFGITLYELLTGSVPFREGDVAFHHRHTTPPDPRGLAEDLPDALAELVQRMLAKQADERPSAGDVAHKLQELVNSLSG